MAIDVADAAHQPNTSIVQHRQIERRMIWSANQLKRRLMARTFDIVNGVGALAQHAEPIQPPKDVVSAVASRQSRVTADSESDLPPGTLNLVGELHAGRGSADNEDAAGRQLFGTPVVRAAPSAGPRAPTIGSRQERPADHSIRSPPLQRRPTRHRDSSTTRKPFPDRSTLCTCRVGNDRRLRRDGVAFQEPNQFRDGHETVPVVAVVLESRKTASSSSASADAASPSFGCANAAPASHVRARRARYRARTDSGSWRALPVRRR